LALEVERCGVDIVETIRIATEGRVLIGPGTLYTLLADFQKAGYIEETAVEGRRRSYKITHAGHDLVESERQRLKRLLEDYERMRGGI
jgi:DNA-binding PadR family transcriptional regulator